MAVKSLCEVDVTAPLPVVFSLLVLFRLIASSSFISLRGVGEFLWVITWVGVVVFALFR